MTDRNAAGAKGGNLPGGKRPYMLAVVAAIIVFILVAPVRVHGGNMSPLLDDGDVVIIFKSAYYDASPPKYGDVLCFKRSFVPENFRTEADGGFDERSYRFARVAGLPGDEMEFRGDGIYRNGNKLSGFEPAGEGAAHEDSSEDAPDSPGGEEEGGASGIRKVGSGEVFVLNDDRSDALDSRDERVDTLLDDVRGRVIFRIWPIDGFGRVN
jgi:signal peptidase I